MNRLERLLHRLNLSPVADDVFAGSAGAGGIGSAGRLFGGLVVAQAFMAAARTSLSGRAGTWPIARSLPVSISTNCRQAARRKCAGWCWSNSPGDLKAWQQKGPPGRRPLLRLALGIALNLRFIDTGLMTGKSPHKPNRRSGNRR